MAVTPPRSRPGRDDGAYPILRLAEPHHPPSSALINVILEYADVQQDLGGRRLILRLSARRMKDPVIREILGREARRLAEVSILWDDEEGEIIRVLDDAAEPPAPNAIEDAFAEFDTFELTEAALDYIARHQAGRPPAKPRKRA